MGLAGQASGFRVRARGIPKTSQHILWPLASQNKECERHHGNSKTECNNQHERINISNEHTGTSMITGAGSLLPPTQVTVYLRRQNDDGKSQGHTATRLSATPSNEPEALNPKPPVIPSPKALNLNSALILNLYKPTARSPKKTEHSQ